MSEVTSNFPQLRFPDFDDKWEEKRLSDIAEKSNVKNRDNEVSSVFTNSATKGVVNQRDFFDKDIANQNNLDGYYIINHDNFVYNPRISFSAPVGPLNRNHLGTGVMSPLYTILKINNVSLDFIERYFKTTKWHRYMNNIANIGARHDRMNIISSDFMKMPIPLPKDEEQQKIAASLAAVDNKIEQLSKKQALLSEYKKGLMQQIFSQAIRFQADDGCDFPDWKERRLEEVANFQRGKNILEDKLGDKLLLGMGSVTEKGNLLINKNTSEQYITLLKNDLVMPERDIGRGLIIGRVALIGQSDKYVLGANILSLTINSDNSSRFLFQIINENNFRKKVRKIVSGSAQLMITSKDAKKLALRLPVIEEQQQIANFLSSIDNKIEQVGKQLDESKQFKKALLQQMFV